MHLSQFPRISKVWVFPAKTIAAAYLVLEGFELFRIKFDDFTTSIADHVVMMRMSERMLIDIAFFRPCNLFDQSALDKKIQSPVNRCA